MSIINSQLKREDLFDFVVRLLEREDRLINSRMTWYLTIQGFIIGSIALIFNGELETNDCLKLSAILLLSCLGILLSIIVFISVIRARKAKENVCRKWEPFCPDDYPDPRGISWLNIWTPGLTVPCLLVAFWTIVIWKIAITNV